MARTAATLPAGSRITDYMSLGVVAKTFPRAHVDDVLKRTGRTSARQRELPAHVVVYYVIALALFMQVSYREVLRCLLEGVQWLMDKVVEPNPSFRPTRSHKAVSPTTRFLRSGKSSGICDRIPKWHL